MQPFQLLVIALAGWLERHQQAIIDCLIEENRIFIEQREGQRLRFTDEQRIRLAVKAKAPGRQLLDELETLVRSVQNPADASGQGGLFSSRNDWK